MSVSIVVGGQFGSEGKGKVAHFLARWHGAAAVVRVGGSNSGHTAVAEDGRKEVLRQLPTAALLPDVLCVLGPGTYIDVPLLLREIERLELAPERLLIDPKAMVISSADQDLERVHGLIERIGSTGSGTGSAVVRRVYRQSATDLAAHTKDLRPYLGNASARLREVVAAGGRVIIEGTQGFGLSLLHGPHFPYATSRDTTAAGALSEAGLSPLDVDDVTLVIRSLPIRVGGNSGPFGAEEIDWSTVAEEGGHSSSVEEFTSVTQRVRRVSRFDPELVRQAIVVNRPSRIVLNHVDLIDAEAVNGMTASGRAFVDLVEVGIGQAVDYVGIGPEGLIPAAAGRALVA
jgi:adenylosuccinate synthase